MHQLRGKKQSALKVDKDNRVISDIVAIELGDIKDYRSWTINEEFLNDLVKSAKKQKEGVLSNYGHNWDNLGKRLGRATNWRVEGNQVKYDLKVFEAADKSPGREGLGTYVMDLAVEDDKAIMNSISFRTDYFYQKDANGKKLKVWYYDKKAGWVTENPDLGSVYPKLKELRSTDIVDEGAATNSLFSKDDLKLQLHHICSNPNFQNLLEDSGDEFIELSKFYDKKQTLSLNNLKRFIHKVWTGEELPPAYLSNDQNNVNMANEDNLAANEEDTQNNVNNEDLSQDLFKDVEQLIGDLKKEIEDLKKEIEDLKDQAPDPTNLNGDEGGSDGERMPAWLHNPMNAHLKERWINNGWRPGKKESK